MRAVEVLIGSAFVVMGLGSLVACGDDSEPVAARPPETTGPRENVLDPTFGTNGFFTWGGTHDENEEGQAVVRQADGKLVIATRNPSAKDYIDVVRLTPSGALDTTFGDGGTGHAIVAGVASTRSVDVAVAPDGKIFVLGITTALFGNPDSDDARILGEEGVLARLDANGVLDPTWGMAVVRFPTIGARWVTWRLSAQSDGKVLVLSHDGGQSKIMRFGSDATLDPTFGTAGVANLPSFRLVDGAIVVDPAGNIVLGANDSVAYTLGSASLWRLRTDGSVDTSFGNGGSVKLPYPHYTIGSLALDAAGRVIVGGSRAPAVGGFIARFTSDGAVDPSFAGGFSVFTPEVVRHVDGDASDRIVGWSTKQLHRFDANGALDATFGRAELSTSTLRSSCRVFSNRTACSSA